jgi:hypothetical protein
MLQKPLANEISRSDIGIETQLLSDPQQSLLGSNGSDSPFGTTDCSKKDGICGFTSGKGGRRKRIVMRIDPCSTERVGLEGENEVGFGRDGL